MLAACRLRTPWAVEETELRLGPRAVLVRLLPHSLDRPHGDRSSRHHPRFLQEGSNLHDEVCCAVEPEYPQRLCLGVPTVAIGEHFVTDAIAGQVASRRRDERVDLRPRHGAVALELHEVTCNHLAPFRHALAEDVEVQATNDALRNAVHRLDVHDGTDAGSGPQPGSRDELNAGDASLAGDPLPASFGSREAANDVGLDRSRRRVRPYPPRLSDEGDEARVIERRAVVAL